MEGDDSPTEKQRRWNDIMQRERAKTTAADGEGATVVNHEGIIALADEVDGQEDEWVVMEGCPDDYALGQ